MAPALARSFLVAALWGAGLACGGAAPATAPPGTDGPPGQDASAPQDAPPAIDVAGAGGGAGETAPAPSADAGDGAASPRACAAFALCDDFEGAAAGAKPDPARWTIGAPNVTGTGVLAIDDAQHHSGARAVKVTGGAGYSNHIFFTNAAAIATVGPVVWGRFYVRLSDALGDGHVTFLAMKDSAEAGKYLRMGGQKNIIMWNRESDDATLPALSPVGIAQSRPLPTNQWLCVELMVDGAQGWLQTWIDGVEIAGMHLDGVATPDLDEQWLRNANWRPKLTDFGLGWESYGDQAMTLWFDDVALDGSRIGCL